MDYKHHQQKTFDECGEIDRYERTAAALDEEDHRRKYATHAHTHTHAVAKKITLNLESYLDIRNL